MSNQSFVPSRYQQAIFDADAKRSLVCVARAGSGKTSTIVELARRFPAGTKALFCAFNKSIATELAARLPSTVEARTLHSAGCRLITQRLGRIAINDDKGIEMARLALDEVAGSAPPAVQAQLTALSVKRLAEFAKNMMLEDFLDLQTVALERDIIQGNDPETFDQVLDLTVRAARRAMILSAANRRCMDFDDMVALPWMLKLSNPVYDVVIVDEAQDMNAAQLSLARSFLKPAGRMIVVGDDRQAIYSFRGADSDALARMARELDAITLPLSVTYRCPVSVVQKAQSIVPDLEAAPDAEQGEVLSAPDCQDAKPGDFIISRKNAPLMSECLALLARGIPATIMGRDIGRTLSTLVQKSRKATVADFLGWLDTYRTREVAKADRLPEGRAEKKHQEIDDRIKCLIALSDGLETCAELLARIESLFSDAGYKNKVLLSSTHRVKGLEADRVFVLETTFNIRQARDQREEQNLCYVAWTRAKKTLVMVSKVFGRNGVE